MGPPMEGAYGRDEDWFNGIYAEHYPRILKYCLRRIADPEACVELTQDVFVVAWRRRRQVPDTCLPWLYQVARRLLANHRRASRTAPRLVPLGDAEPSGLRGTPGGAYPAADSAAEIAGIHAALATLSEPHQEILRLVGWEELTVAEAAVVLGCSRTTAAVRLHRARRRLIAAMATTQRTPRIASPVGAHTGGDRDN